MMGTTKFLIQKNNNSKEKNKSNHYFELYENELKEKKYDVPLIFKNEKIIKE